MPDPRNDLEPAIRAAFAGVVLGGGTSLSDAEYADSYGKDDSGQDISLDAFQKRRALDVVDDWSSVTLAELDRDNIAHMDAEGFRYYLPALMLSVISDYDSGSMRVIGTLSVLCPRSCPPYHWSELLHQYALLDRAQKRVVAQFLTLLPDIVDLDVDDRKLTERALERHWKTFLPENEPDD